MRYLLQIPYSIWLGLCFLLCCTAAMPFYPLAAVFDERRRLIIIFSVNRWCMVTFSILVGMPIRIEQADLRPTQAVMLIGNHCNLLDMPVCASALLRPAMPLAKAEFAKVPVIGYLMKRFAVLIQRESAESRRMGAQSLINKLREGTSVLVFPEGTRNRGSEPLQAFRDGAFRAAISAGVPIQPFVQLHMRRAQKLNTLLFRPSRLVFRYLAPIPTAGLGEQDVAALRDRVRAVIEAELLRDDVVFSRAVSKP